MRCINCFSVKKHKIVNGVLLDFCVDCGMVFLDLGELDLLVECKKRKTLDLYIEEKLQISLEKNLKTEKCFCPRCNGNLSYKKEYNIRYVFCSDCGGIFLKSSDLNILIKEKRKSFNVFKRLFLFMKEKLNELRHQ